MLKILLVAVTLMSVSTQATEDYKRCYKINKFMDKNSVGKKSEICEFYFYTNNNRLCFFTSDNGWYTHTFQVSCNQFSKLDTIAKSKKIKPLLTNL